MERNWPLTTRTASPERQAGCDDWLMVRLPPLSMRTTIFQVWVVFILPSIWLPAAALPTADKPVTPVDDIVNHLNEAGITQIKKHAERYVVEFCDDCGAPLFADPVGELAHAEMPEDTPAGTEHFH